MIKINLATRKQAVVADDGKKAEKLKLGFGGGGSELKDQLVDLLKDPNFRKVALAVLAAYLGSYVVDGIKQDDLKKYDEIIAQNIQTQDALNKKLDKLKGYEQIKAQLEADEKTIRDKLTTIQALMADRQVPPKMLIALANSVPSDVWLSDFELAGQDIHMHGSGSGFEPLSEFLKSLGENPYITAPQLKSAQKVHEDNTGLDVATFELEAKKR